ncbi:alpha-galactosidase [Amnibacterium kyonggiense]|nr:alpha-galactosidase [Amnibacterium kyonggiense]
MVPESDVSPLEFASDGQRHTAFAELLIDRGNGRTGARWTVLDDLAADSHRLTVPFIDETGTLRLELHYATSPEHDAVRRWVRLTNTGSEAVELRRAFSAGWNLPLGPHVRVEHLAGWWAGETRRRSTDLEAATLSIGSRMGITGFEHAPVLTLTAATNTSEAYGIALAWSGSWRMRAESPAVGRHVRVSGGPHEDTTVVALLPGETYESPESIGVRSDAGSDGIRRAWHEYERTLARDHGEHHRPVVYNSWYATTFNVREEHQAVLAERAARLGAEVFVLDDGWFAGRDDDTRGLGDWRPDSQKFPDGLRPLADRVRGLGMRFGVWIEPECVDPDSDLFRAHPDWIYRADGRPALTIRNQYVLDLGRPEVEAWIADVLRRLLDSAPITYLKWDMNRAVTDGGRPGDPHGREWSIQHVRAYHRLLDLLRSEFPEVTVEACASGGARIDLAVLARSDVVWTSDEVGPRDRLAIQHGFLTAYPASVMSSWVTDEPGSVDRSSASLGYRFAVAMCGVLGVGADLLRWNDVELERGAAMVAAYKDLRGVVHRGEAYFHGDPADPTYAIEFRGPDDDPRQVLLVFDRDRERRRDRDAVRIRPVALRPGTSYRSDAFALPVTAGGPPFTVPFRWAEDADVLVLTPIDNQEEP